MTPNQKHFIPKAAALVAGSALVLTAFVPLFAGAQTTTTTTTTTTASYTFTRDLTIGSTGPDVVALQTWLIAHGFLIPAGPTGYFGTQTRAAVSAFQAANGIQPTAGYFGPITRGRILAMTGTPVSTIAGCLPGYNFSPTTGQPCTSTTTTIPGCFPGYLYSATTGQPCTSTTTGGGTTTGTLSGGEADLRNFDLVAGNDLSEGDTNSEIATARFDVENGDINVQRVTVDLTSQSGSYNRQPWQYITDLSVYDGGTKVGSVNVDSKDDWDQNGNTYSIDIPVNDIVRQGDQAELSIRADAQNTIDSSNLNQTFQVSIPDNGIRAVDAAGIQEYTGDSNDTVTVGFNAEQTGKLNITTSSDNPSAGVLVADTTNTSDTYDVLSFNIRNTQDTDVDLDTMTFSVATSSASGSPAGSIRDIIRRATLDLNGDTYTGTVNANNTITFDNLNTTVNGNDTIDGTLSVELYGQDNHFGTGETLTFTLDNSNVTAESSDTGDTSTVSGSATGNTQSISTNVGMAVAGAGNTTSEAYNSTSPTTSTGTFVLKFDVTASGDDVYIPKSIEALPTGSTPNATTGVVVRTDLGADSSTATSVATSLGSTADTAPGNSGYYIVRAGDTETFTAYVTMDPSAAGYYQVGLDAIRFNDTPSTSGLQTLDVNQNDSQFQTQQLYIH